MKVVEEEGFLEEIQDNPADDAPRLIFADWLDERRDPRAEFIRVQCEAARRAAAHPCAAEPTDSERRLLDERRTECLAELGRLGVKDVRFSRGFVEKILCQGLQILDHPRSLLRHAPALRGLILRNPPRNENALLARILTSGHLRCLTTLDLSRNQLRSIGFAEFDEEDRRVRLTTLNLAGNQLSGRGIDELLSRSYLTGMASLNLSGNELSVHDARLLSRSPHLTALKSLNLDDNSIGDDGFRLLANSTHLVELNSLAVNKNQITAAGIRAFANSPQPLRLASLNLADNHLGQTGASVLVSSSSLGQLTALNLARCGIGADGARSIASSLHLRSLCELDLSGNQIEAGAESLAGSQNLPALKVLNLSQNDITLVGARAIVASGEMQRLETLDLSGNPFKTYPPLIAAFGSTRLRL